MQQISQIFYGILILLYNDNTAWISGLRVQYDKIWVFANAGGLEYGFNLMVSILFLRNNTDCLGCIIIGNNSNLFINKHFVKSGGSI